MADDEETFSAAGGIASRVAAFESLAHPATTASPGQSSTSVPVSTPLSFSRPLPASPSAPYVPATQPVTAPVASPRGNYDVLDRGVSPPPRPKSLPRSHQNQLLPRSEGLSPGLHHQVTDPSSPAESSNAPWTVTLAPAPTIYAPQPPSAPALTSASAGPFEMSSRSSSVSSLNELAAARNGGRSRSGSLLAGQKSQIEPMSPREQCLSPRLPVKDIISLYNAPSQQQNGGSASGKSVTGFVGSGSASASDAAVGTPTSSKSWLQAPSLPARPKAVEHGTTSASAQTSTSSLLIDSDDSNVSSALSLHPSLEPMPSPTKTRFPVASPPSTSYHPTSLEGFSQRFKRTTVPPSVQVNLQPTTSSRQQNPSPPPVPSRARATSDAAKIGRGTSAGSTTASHNQSREREAGGENGGSMDDDDFLGRSALDMETEAPDKRRPPPPPRRPSTSPTRLRSNNGREGGWLEVDAKSEDDSEADSDSEEGMTREGTSARYGKSPPPKLPPRKPPLATKPAPQHLSGPINKPPPPPPPTTRKPGSPVLQHKRSDGNVRQDSAAPAPGSPSNRFSSARSNVGYGLRSPGPSTIDTAPASYRPYVNGRQRSGDASSSVGDSMSSIVSLSARKEPPSLPRRAVSTGQANLSTSNLRPVPPPPQGAAASTVPSTSASSPVVPPSRSSLGHQRSIPSGNGGGSLNHPGNSFTSISLSDDASAELQSSLESSSMTAEAATPSATTAASVGRTSMSTASSVPSPVPAGRKQTSPHTILAVSTVSAAGAVEAPSSGFESLDRGRKELASGLSVPDVASRRRYEALFERNVRALVIMSGGDREVSSPALSENDNKGGDGGSGGGAEKMKGWWEQRGHASFTISPAAEAARQSPPRLHGTIVRRCWQCSRLSRATLRAVWHTVDKEERGSLDREAFVKGMWMIDEELRTKAGDRDRGIGGGPESRRKGWAAGGSGGGAGRMRGALAPWSPGTRSTGSATTSPPIPPRSGATALVAPPLMSFGSSSTSGRPPVPLPPGAKVLKW